MSSLFSRYLCLEEASAESEVSDQVEHLMPCALVRETEREVAEVTVFAYRKCGNVEKLRHPAYLLVGHRMLDNHDRVVDVTAFDQSVVEEEFYLVEEYESPACSA